MIRRERRDGGEAWGNEEREKRRERIEKGTRERIEIERDRRELRWQFEEEEEEHHHLLFSFLKALRYSSQDTSSRLDSAVKRCSSISLQRSNN